MKQKAIKRKRDEPYTIYEKAPENEFKFVCGYCGYESDSNDKECYQCGCKHWLYIEDLTPKEKDTYGLEDFRTLG